MKRRDALKSLGIGATALATLNGEALESFGRDYPRLSESFYKTDTIRINDRQRYVITMQDLDGELYAYDTPTGDYIGIKTSNQHIKIHVEQPRYASTVQYSNKVIRYMFPILVSGENTTYGDFYITDIKNDTKKLVRSISENGHEPSIQGGKMRAVVWCSTQPIESKDGLMSDLIQYNRIIRGFDSCLKIELITESKV